MSTIEKIGDWTYESFDAREPASSFGQFESLVVLWQSRMSGTRLPGRQDFAFEDFIGWHGYLCIGDVEPDLSDVRFRLWGTSLVSLFDCDLTGKRMCDAEPGFFEHCDFDHISKIVSDRIIMTGTGPIYWQNRDHLTVYTIKLPLAEDGSTVNKILWAVTHRGGSENSDRPQNLSLI